MWRRFVSLFSLAALSAVRPLRAQEASPARRVSVTISPLHLLGPELRVAGELRLGSRVSGAAVIGGGRVSEEEQAYRTREIGGQVRYYVLGSFGGGMMVGADVGHIDVNGELEGAMEMLVGTRAGGFLGYKHLLKRGFTAEVQLGPVHVWGDAGRTEWQTLHHLLIGWSF